MHLGRVQCICSIPKYSAHAKSFATTKRSTTPRYKVLSAAFARDSAPPLQGILRHCREVFRVTLGRYCMTQPQNILSRQRKVVCGITASIVRRSREVFCSSIAMYEYLAAMAENAFSSQRRILALL